MRIPDKLKLNKFRLVVIPSTRDIFMRIGPRELPKSAYTGEEQEVVYQSTKVEEIDRANNELREALERESHEDM